MRNPYQLARTLPGRLAAQLGYAVRGDDVLMSLLLVLTCVPGLSTGNMREMLSFLAVEGRTMKALPLRERSAARTKSDFPPEPEPSTLLGALASLSNPPPKQQRRDSQH